MEFTYKNVHNAAVANLKAKADTEDLLDYQKVVDLIWEASSNGQFHVRLNSPRKYTLDKLAALGFEIKSILACPDYFVWWNKV